jgi:hypothetical protein
MPVPKFEIKSHTIKGDSNPFRDTAALKNTVGPPPTGSKKKQTLGGMKRAELIAKRTAGDRV